MAIHLGWDDLLIQNLRMDDCQKCSAIVLAQSAVGLLQCICPNLAIGFYAIQMAARASCQ
jgi:hypothetical protein